MVAHLVEESYHRMLAEGTGDLVRRCSGRPRGSSGPTVWPSVADAEPGTIIACRKDSPIVVELPATGSFTWPPTSLR